MEKNKLNDLKKETKKILYTESTINEKEKQFIKLQTKYNVEIDMPSDGIGVYGVYVRENGNPLFAMASKNFNQWVKDQKEDYITALKNLNAKNLSKEKGIKECVIIV